MLTVSLGQASHAGRRGSNQDFLGCVTPEGDVLRDKGMAFAVADGISRGRNGKAAAETAIRSFLSGYFSSPDTWGRKKCLEQALAQANSEIRDSAPGGAATFAALVLQGGRFFVVHVGDARIYLLRRGILRQLTADHVWEHPDMRNVVSRAVGLDAHIHPDFHQEEMEIGDLFLLCTDGFYKPVIPEAESLGLVLRGDLQDAVETLAATAGRAGGEDDLTIQIIRVEAIPVGEKSGTGTEASELPLAEEVKAGLTIDEFYLVRRLHRGMLSEVYLAEDLRGRRKVVLKFPRSGVRGGEDESKIVERFLREEWVGRRVRNPHVISALTLEAGRRTRLYYAMPWQEGETLRERLREGPLAPQEVVDIGIRLGRGLEALHRLQVMHRDIKPDNVLLEERGGVVLLDLGVAHAESFASVDAVPGTPSYMAPEMFRGAAADERTEVYALGVTLYESLTRKFPYGEVQPFSQPVFRQWIPPSRYNPEIPLWLETVLRKALEADPARRFQLLSEMQFHLERCERVEGEEPRRPAHDPGSTIGIWKILTCVFALLSILEFLLLIQSGR